MKKVLLVTGASSEVGIYLLKRVFHLYDTIVLQYNHMNLQLQEVIEQVSNGVEVVPIHADFSSDIEIENFISFIKEREIIPNSIVHLPAPKAYNKQFHKDSIENFNLGWQISVQSIVRILQAFLPGMVKQKYGRIVFMLTSCTVDMPPKFQSSYVTAKYALLGLMKSLSVEYAGKGITVNGVSPDMMETKFMSELPELIVQQNSANSPIGRNIMVSEVIPVIELMLSEQSNAITGQNIAITGGM